VAAAQTGIEMAAQGRRATVLNRSIGFELLKTEALLVPFEEAAALGAEDIGHLHGGAAHFCFDR